MGMTAALIGLAGAAVGLGASALLGRGSSKNASAMYGNLNNVQFDPTQAASMAMTPIDTVQAAEDGTTNNALMEEERNKSLQAAAAANKESAGVLTSGLGLTGNAATMKKGLLGG